MLQAQHPHAADFMFFNLMRGGEPHDTKTLNYWFRKLLIRLGANPSYKLNPHMLRHIFVGERRSSDAVAGPRDESAALMMGHGLRQWEVYDSRWWDRQVDECVADMQAWRQALLQRAAACENAEPVQQQDPGYDEAEPDELQDPESDDDEFCIGLEDESSSD